MGEGDGRPHLLRPVGLLDGVVLCEVCWLGEVGAGGGGLGGVGEGLARTWRPGGGLIMLVARVKDGWLLARVEVG